MKKMFNILGKKETLVLLFTIALLSCNTKVPSNVETTPSATPVVEITPIPTPTTSIPVVIVSATPVVQTTPTPIPTATPLPESYKGTLSGKVYNDRGIALEDILVKAESSDKNFPYKEETKTVGGAYAFRNVPVAVPINVSVFKSDTWTSKEQSAVLKSNISGSLSQTTLDFGDVYPSGSVYKTNDFYISDAPEIISIEPNASSLIEHNGIKLKIVFSENVQKKSFEDNFEMRYVNEDVNSNVVLGDGTNGTTNTDGPPLLNGEKQIIIDKDTDAAQLVWDTNTSTSYGKEVIFSIPSYAGVSASNDHTVFYGITVRKNTKFVKLLDKDDNIALSEGEFFVNSSRSKNVLFNIAADKTSPELKEVKLEKDSSYCYVKAVFSEPMSVIGFSNPDLYEQSFYTLYKNGVKINPVDPKITLTNPDTIQFTLPVNTFKQQDIIKVEVSQNLKDPAGNFFSHGQTNNKEDYIKEKKYEN